MCARNQCEVLYSRVIPTLPLLFSTHIAFFLRSIHKSPATVLVMVDGGVCLSPGPSLSGSDDFWGTGRTSSERTSPGITRLWEAIAPKCN